LQVFYQLTYRIPHSISIMDSHFKELVMLSSTFGKA